MKDMRIQKSLKSLHKDIGNCEKQLSQALKGNEFGRIRSESVTKNPNLKPTPRQHSVSRLSRRISNQTQGNQISRDPHSPCKNGLSDNRSVLCKEIIGDKNAPARVEVIVRTQSFRKRSRSVQDRRVDQEISSKNYDSRKGSLNVEDRSSTQGKNASWGHILQNQGSSSRLVNRTKRGRAKTLLYPSSDDDHSSGGLEQWVQSIPKIETQTKHNCLNHAANSNVSATVPSTVSPLRTLNFLVKELRGKVHKDCANDTNMQRIIEDMEKTLCCISLEVSNAPTKFVPMSSQSRNVPCKPRRSACDNVYSSSIRKDSSKSNNHQEQNEIHGSPDLVRRLLTVQTMARGAEEQENGHLGGKLHGLKAPSVNIHQEQLEIKGSVSDETFHQVEKMCDSLRQQNIQLLNELKIKSQQIELVASKNQQLKIYAADVRQDVLRIQQAAEIAQQDSEKIKQKLLTQLQELQESSCHLSKQLKETRQENEQLNTELQLCRLEKDKMHILMSNKDLEVAKLKKEIVDIHTLVTEQLMNIQTLSGKKYPSEELHKMMEAVSRLYVTFDSANSTLVPHATGVTEGIRSHIGNGEGSRSRPICSSPTSSVNSSLYNSWQLMSDITTPEKNSLKDEEEIFQKTTKERSSGKSDRFEIKLAPVGASGKKDTENLQQSAQELKDGLRDVFSSLKQQTSDAVNVTLLPAVPTIFEKPQDTFGVSQWTDLSASDSTVLFYSSDESESDSDEM